MMRRTLYLPALLLAIVPAPAVAQTQKPAAPKAAPPQKQAHAVPLNSQAASALGEAMAFARTIPDAQSRATSLLAIGQDLCQAGDVPAVRKLLPDAVSAVNAYTR